ELIEARTLLARLRDNLEEIERTNNMTTKRAVVEALVHGIAIEAQPDGAVCAHVRYRFGRPRVARAVSPTRPATSRAIRWQSPVVGSVVPPWHGPDTPARGSMG
ncbi:MAG TPA: hypothetical protein VI542_04850, partial [Candidatus Tectomicrobia bacterium]